jgi:hypothetical protein
MKYKSTLVSFSILLTVFSSLLLTQTVFAATPYNALAQTLTPDTTTGVFNPETDTIKKDTIVEGIVWGINGSTFIVRLPNDDAGYNILLTKETIIRNKGKATTKKDIKKGMTVLVMGDLDVSTYTFSAKTVDLGTVSKQPAVIEPTKIVSIAPIKPVEPVVKTTNQIIAKTLKQGAKNADVKLLQEKLIKLGFLSKGSSTGYYGPQTTKAVKAFQKANKLDQVGSVGTKTLKLLNS